MFNNNMILYGVRRKDSDTFITVTKNLNDAKEYFYKWSKIKWQQAFETWCHWKKDQDITSEKSWAEFFSQDHLQEQANEYTIVKLKFPKSSVASIFRMFGSCVPVGASFEEPAELSYFTLQSDAVESNSLRTLKAQLHELFPKDEITTKDNSIENGHE